MDLSRARNLWETRERELRARESVTRAQMVDKMTSGRSQRVVVVVEAMRANLGDVLVLSSRFRQEVEEESCVWEERERETYT